MTTANILFVENPPHFTGRAILNKQTHVRVDGKYLYVFSHVRLPYPSGEDSTIIWKNYDTHDPFNLDGLNIGDSDVSVSDWLESQGFTVVETSD